MASAVHVFIQDHHLTPAGIQLVVGLTTLSMVVRFTLDAWRHRSGSHTMKMILLSLDVVTFSMIQYSLGIMQRPSATNSYYQVWAVLLVTLRYSVKIGRPAGITMKQTPLVDLMSSFWAANILRSQERKIIKIPGWLLWSVNSVRIIHGFVSSEHANNSHKENMRLLTDYMRHEHEVGGQAGQPSDASTMVGYRYLVLGEALQKNKQKKEGDEQVGHEATENVQRLLLALNNKDLITLEKIWKHKCTAQSGSICNLPAGCSDILDEKLKDLCLSFALYKLLRRRFFNLDIHEANLGKTKQLVLKGILGGNPELSNSDSKRAFRVSEAEVAFLNDFFNSRHAIIFAEGFPFLRLLLSTLLIGGISGMAVAIYRFSKSSMEGEVRHGVIFTWILLSFLGAKEIWEIITYVFSDWTKVLLLCKYVEQPWWLRCSVAKALVKVLCRCRLYNRWHGKVGQYDLLFCSNKFLCWRWRRPPFSVVLHQQVKHSVIKSLNRSLRSRRLDNYLEEAFQQAKVTGQLQDKVNAAVNELQGDVHILLVWHIATGYCRLHLDQSTNSDPDLRGSHFITAMTLSQYCAYVLTLIPPLVPGNSLMAKAVFNEVHREKNRLLGNSKRFNDILQRLREYASGERQLDDNDKGDTILKKGAVLGMKLIEATSGGTGNGDLWEFLSEFWAGFVLHLAESTRASQHKIFLSRGGELMTHLWALLSHAGHLGAVTHGHQPDYTVLVPVQDYDQSVQS